MLPVIKRQVSVLVLVPVWELLMWWRMLAAARAVMCARMMSLGGLRRLAVRAAEGSDSFRHDRDALRRAVRPRYRPHAGVWSLLPLQLIVPLLMGLRCSAWGSQATCRGTHAVVIDLSDFCCVTYC